MLATHPKRRWPFVSKAVSMSCTLGLLVYAYCAQSARNRPAAAMALLGAGGRPFCYAMRPCEGRSATTQGRPIEETASDRDRVSEDAMGAWLPDNLGTSCVAH